MNAGLLFIAPAAEVRRVRIMSNRVKWTRREREYEATGFVFVCPMVKSEKSWR